MSPAMERMRELHRLGRYREDEVFNKCISSWVCRQ